jgi:hypothetical protein
MMKKTVFLVVLSIVALAMAIRADSDGDGGQAGAFRDLEIGGRPSAMGGAFTAIAEGGVGYFYNPAGLAQTHDYTVGFAYRAMHLDRRLGYFSVGIPAREEARLSIDWLHAGTDPLDARDEQGNIILGEEISYSENLIGATFSKKFGTNVILGGKLFYAQNDVANISASTAGIDIGGLVKLDARKTFLNPVFPLVQFGAVVENIGANYRWATANYWESRGSDRGVVVDESFPTNFRVGTALVSPYSHIFSADLEINTASMIKSHFGGEYTYKRALSLRAGLDDLHPTVGLGVFKKFDAFALWVDFSYLTDKADEGDDVLVSFDLSF